MVARTTSEHRRPGLSLRAREELAGYLCIAPWLIGFAVFFLGAVAYSLYLSLFDSNLLTQHDYIGLQNYLEIADDPVWRTGLVNTAYYTFVSVSLSIVLAFAVALLLNQPIRFRRVYRTIYYLPAVVSGVPVSLLWLWMFNPDIGLIAGGFRVFGLEGPAWLTSETWAMPAIIIMGLWGLGNSVVILLAGLQGVPAHLYEAAKIDGANDVACFWHVTVPMMTPSLFFLLILGIIGAFQIFTQPFVMTGGGPNNATLTSVMQIYNKGFRQFSFGYASALAWVLFVVILLFSLLAIRLTASRVYYEGEAR